VRVAALYDVHGNLPALEAVLAEVEREQLDAIVLGGDFVFGPLPRATLDAMLSLGDRARFVLGNADRWFLDVYDGRVEPEPEDAWLLEQLDASRREFFAALPRRLVMDVDGLGSVLFCHGSPRSEDEIITAITTAERLRPMLEDVEQRLVICGHTHVQFDRTIEGTRIVNAGSVGMPYEDAPGARWAMLGPDVVLRRTPYDLDAGAERLRASRWGRVDEFVEKYLFDPPSAAQASEHFERMATTSAPTAH
jgi:diadenosine tetraphosphatase ApaH/serine/threonine PP2A family protein phosphatase